MSCYSSRRELEGLWRLSRYFSSLNSRKDIVSQTFQQFNKHITPNVSPETQCGFHSGRPGTTDMTVCLNQLQEKCIVQNMPLYAVFSDFSKAFDIVPCKGLWKVLGEYGCPANGKGTAQRNASTCG